MEGRESLSREILFGGQFEIAGPTGEKFLPPPGRFWRCNEKQYRSWLEDGRITFGRDNDGRPMLKKFLSEVEQGLTPNTWWEHEVFGTNKEASIELKALFDGEAVFDTPKPVRLLQRICALTDDPEALVLDFFAGSGTTGHAVMQQNATDGGLRRFVLVQLPEVIKEAKGVLRTIADVTKERLRRAGKKVKEDNPMFAGDLGFRVFKLASSNIRAWEPDRDDLPTTLMDSIEHLKTDRTEQDILFELLLKLGLDLTIPIEQKPIAGKAVHNIGAGTLLVCLAEKIVAAEVEPLAQGIVAWHKALAPVGETTVVFRDSAFANDMAKTNLTAILQQHGLENVRSL